MVLSVKKSVGEESEFQETTTYPSEAYKTQNIGGKLRDARIERGLSAESVGAALRIKPHHILALERGDVSGIAGMTYALGYLRSYATYMGFDGSAAVRQFKLEFDGTPPVEPLTFPIPVKEVKFPTGRVLAFSLIMAVLGYGGYYYLSRSGKVTAANAIVVPPVPPVPSELAEQIPPIMPPVLAPGTQAQTKPTSTYAAPIHNDAVAPSKDAMSPATAKLTDSTTRTTAAAGPSSSSSVAAQTLPVPAPTTTETGAGKPEASSPSKALAVRPPVAPVAVPPASVQTSAAVTAADGQVILKANADSWVQIQGAGNKQIFTRILRAGETYTVPARKNMTLVTGNAGALEILVDGKSTGPLGAMGKVKRNISLNPDDLLAMIAKDKG